MLLSKLSKNFISLKSVSHPFVVSVNDNTLIQTNLTHSNVVNNIKTMPVGIDISGKNSFAVTDIIIVDGDLINDMDALNLLINYKNDLTVKFEICPTRDMKLMYTRIGFIAQYYDCV
jgi:hypothetical protein